MSATRNEIKVSSSFDSKSKEINDMKRKKKDSEAGDKAVGRPMGKCKKVFPRKLWQEKVILKNTVLIVGV